MADLGELAVLVVADASQLESSLSKSKGVVSSFGDKVAGLSSGLASGLAAGATVAAAGVAAVGAAALGVGVQIFSSAQDIATAQNNLVASLGVSQSEAEALKDVALDVFAGDKTGLADNVGDATEAIIAARSQLKGLGDQELGQATMKALQVSKAFDQDLGEVLNSTNVLMDEFGLSSTQAFDFISSGFQKGLNSSDDFLGGIGEYGNQFSSIGLDADEMFSIMQTGLAGGVLGTDKIADAMKEYSLIMNEGGEDAREALSSIGLSLSDMQTSVGDGDKEWGDFLDQIIGGIESIPDPIRKAQAQVALFGTQAEDLGTAFTDGLSTSATTLDQLAGATEKTAAKFDTFGALFSSFKKSAITALTPLSEKLLQLGSKIMPIVDEALSRLGPIIASAVDQALPAFDAFIAFIEGTAIPVVQNLAGLFSSGLGDSSAFDMLKAAIEPLMPAIQGLFAIFEENRPQFEAFGNFVATVLVSSFNALVVVLSTVASVGGSLLLGFVEAAILTIGGLAEAFSGAIDLISGLFSGDWTKALGGAEKIFQGFVTVVSAFWVGLNTSLTSIFSKSWANILTNLKGFFSEFLSGSVGFLASLVTSFAESWNLVVDGVSEAAGNLLSAFNEMIETIVEFIKNVEWVAIATSIIDDLVSGLTDNSALSALAGAADEIVDEIKDQFSGFVSKGKDLIKDLVEGIRSADLSSMGTAALAMGKKFIEEFVKGLKANVNLIITWFTTQSSEWIKVVVQTLKDKVQSAIDAILGDTNNNTNTGNLRVDPNQNLTAAGPSTVSNDTTATTIVNITVAPSDLGQVLNELGVDVGGKLQFNGLVST